MKAIWKNTVLAESDDTVVVENNHYFPKASLKADRFASSDYKTYCPWKGEASYYSISAGGETNADAAWFYPTPFEAADMIRDRVAFWKGVQVVD